MTDYINTESSIHFALFDSPPAIAVVRNIQCGTDRGVITRDVASYA